jgi:DNA-binding NarL/FixJ family response regulator
LTPQQRRVLTLIRQGLSNKQIAHILAVGESTVKSHVTQLLRKLEMNTRTQVAVTVTMHDAPPYAEAD